ncbi:uncharacterized protein L3040_007479 [Drepanopeziza brunnea f. sp. 'multigermtubi']|nr:hypothetical protein L3040_007479 [Drepanopeziza brunnea f. sp. 'multigermtubi']
MNGLRPLMERKMRTGIWFLANQSEDSRQRDSEAS